MSSIVKDLGIATAYGYAKSQGYTGTEEEFAVLMASYASVGQEAVESALKAEGFAVGTQDGEASPEYAENNAEYFKALTLALASQAASSASVASQEADSAEIDALKAEGWAIGEQNGASVPSSSPYYENNARWYASVAGGHASTATTKAGEASQSADNALRDAGTAGSMASVATADALKAEGYAVGKQNGVDVASGSPYYENNAKFYAEYAEDVKDSIPLDYTNLSNEVQDLKSALNGNALYGNQLFAGLNNLFDMFDAGIENGKYISNISSGSEVWTNSSTLSQSGYIPVKAGHMYILYSYISENKPSPVDHLVVALYDSNKNPLNMLTANPMVNLPANSTVAYIRIPFLSNTPSASAVFDVSKIANRSLSAIEYGLNAEKTFVKERTNLILFLTGYQQYFNRDDADVSYYGYIDSVSSNAPHWAVSSSQYGETGYISVSENDKIAVLDTIYGDFLQMPIACFDSSKNIVSVKTAGSSKYITVPSGISYIRCGFLTKNIDGTIVMKVKDIDTPLSVANFGLLNRIISLKSQIDLIQPSTNQWYGKKWYVYGTSISNTASEGKYPTYVAQMSGMIMTSKGVSGGGIGNFGVYSTGQVYNRICNITDGKLEADLITLETGANDVDENTPLGTIYDTGTSTLAGCLNDCIRYLQTNTNAQIAIMCSPADKREPQAANQYYKWAAMIEEICHINRVHFINSDNNMGYAKLTSSNGSLYVVDNIHHTDLGGYIMAQNIWYQLKNIPCFYTAIPN